MGTTVTKTTTWTEIDSNGQLVEYKRESSCGPVCKTVKVALVVGVLALLLSSAKK